MNKPVVYISNYNGRLGNHMFQFAWAISVAKKLDYGVCIPGIAGGTRFPRTNTLECDTPPDKYVYIGPGANLPYWHKDEYTDVEEFKKLHYGENLRGDSYFQNYKNFNDNKDELKYYFELPYNDKGKNKLGIHIRLTDHPQQYRPKMDYFYNAIESSTLKDNMYIFTDQPNHPCISDIKSRYRGAEVSHVGPLEDLTLLSSCDEMIMSRSTYSWWAGYLGYSKKVYFPGTSTGFFSSGFWVDDDDRYIKIKSD